MTGGVCFRTPDEVLTEWARDHGLPGLAPDRMTPYFEEVERRSHVELVPAELRSRLDQVRLGRRPVVLKDVERVTVEVIENLFSTDLAYLQEFYRRINEEGAPRIHAKCPSCQHEFDIDLLGGGDGRVVGQGG